jgi:KEOPS complex subunit Cgi121
MRVVEGRATVADVDDFVERLGVIGDEHGVVVQAFDARYVVDREHLERAVSLADRAFDRGEGIARDRAVEILLYAAGRRQINRALAMGVGEGESPVVVVVHDPSGEGDEDGGAATLRDLLDPAVTLGDYDEALVRDFFDVSEAELEATSADLADLVRERVALLTVEK